MQTGNETLYFKHLFWVWIFLSVIAGLLALTVPIYTDEIGYQWIYSRFWIEGNYIIKLTPQCQEAWNTSIPVLFLPFRAFDSFLFGNLGWIFKLRLAGFITSCLWIFLGIRLCALSLKHFIPDLSSGNRLRFLVFIAALLQLGTFPFLRNFERPEQFVLLFLLILLYLGLKNRIAPSVKKQTRALQYFLFVICLVGLFAYHVKSLLLIPIVLFSVFAFEKRVLGRIVLFTITVVSSVVSMKYFQEIAACEKVSFLTYLQSLGTIPLQYFWNAPAYVVHLGTQNILGFLQYLKPLFFLPQYQSFWLPPLPISNRFSLLLNFPMLLLIGGTLFAALISFLIYTRKLFSLCVLTSIFAITFIQGAKNFYETILIYPLCILFITSVVISLPQNIFKIFQKYIPMFALLVSTFSLISLLALWVKQVPVWTSGQILENQPSSTSAFHFEKRKQEITAAALKCGIDPTRPLYRLVVDDYTVPVFWNTSDPYHLNYITGFFGQRMPELRVFMARRESSGLIAQCKNIPESFMLWTKSSGDLCCASAIPVDWQDWTLKDRWEKPAR